MVSGFFNRFIKRIKIIFEAQSFKHLWLEQNQPDLDILRIDFINNFEIGSGLDKHSVVPALGIGLAICGGRQPYDLRPLL